MRDRTFGLLDLIKKCTKKCKVGILQYWRRLSLFALAQDVVNNVNWRGALRVDAGNLLGSNPSVIVVDYRGPPVLDIRPDGDYFDITKRLRVVHGTPSITCTSYMRAASRSPQAYNKIVDNIEVATGPIRLPPQARGGIISAGVTDHGGLPYERR